MRARALGSRSGRAADVRLEAVSSEHPLVATTPREPTARMQAAVSLMPGARIAHYRVLSQLGAGGTDIQ